MRIVLLVSFLLIFTAANCQMLGAKRATCYRVNKYMCTFAAVSTTEVLASDSVCESSFGELLEFNRFLERHSKCNTPVHGNPKYPFDIRTAYTFYDDAGTKHIIGFGVFGDYQLDGVAYNNNDLLKPYVNALGVCIVSAN